MAKMKKEQVMAQADAHITVTKKGAEGESQQSTQEVVSGHKFAAEPAVVSISYGLTKNLGNFESARVDISLSMPCEPDKVDATAIAVEAWVKERLGRELADLNAAKPSQPKTELPF